ncbi:NUDIX hydrolase [Sphingomonas baiyangensis]|uniref:NUDIX hydrolase n=1 Tax=Sphingomonas baiyangensis TaxID=2572576 RepID=A0A4U1L3F4_9SPHN|nr:NUDIX domain-containing protein [Sphingomonas baiyangensis]TKD51409.1 NUDIX hydrolase [Sphingomonas baiyangensis]
MDFAADPAIPAATLVVMRACAGGPPEILMVERSRAMAFAGGALVFPGGRVDPADHEAAALLAPDSDADDIAARIAAIRETIEEAGVAIGIEAPLDIERARARLYAGEPLTSVVAPGAIRLDKLEPFARWLPRHKQARTFDTRFYLAELPADAPPPLVDGNENVRLFWATAAAVLAMAQAGEARLIFPTRRNLERLAQHASHAEAVADARRYPLRAITPWTEAVNGVEHVCIDDDLGYPVTREPVTSALRA